MLKKLGFVSLFFLLFLTACNTTAANGEANNLSSEKYEELLSNTNEFRIKEATFSLGKAYNVYVDDTLVATVKGEVIKVTGDVLTMTDPNDKLLIKEKQIKRWGFKFTRSGVFLDENDNEIGYLGEKTITKLTNLGHYFHFYDKNKEEIGVSDEIVFSFLKKYDFKDSKGNIAYKVKQEPGFVDKYTVTVNDDKNIPRLQAIIMICIQDAIKDAEDEKE
ncbi:hypothetical protein AAGG74_15335 [Bacillus mexicanus]|uniref:hypothetical protein n=1 Tax=Bacillus mexicanus TaxID=2834415 RepID=UPI003D2186ED